MRVFEARVAGGLLGSRVKVSAISSDNMIGLCSSVQGTTDMEMERLWVLVGCSRVERLPVLVWGLLGEKALLSCWGSELQEPESRLRSSVSLALFRQERAAVRRE